MYAQEEIKEGEEYPSPDGKFVAQLKLKGSDYILSIKDTKKGFADESQGILTPLFSLKWTEDSKTIIAVSHLAGGSVATVFHFDKIMWDHFDVEPTDGDADVEAFDVIKQELKFSTVKITYNVTEEVRDDQGQKDFKFYKFVLAVDPEKETFKLVKKQQISTKEYTSPIE